GERDGRDQRATPEDRNRAHEHRLVRRGGHGLAGHWNPQLTTMTSPGWTMKLALFFPLMASLYLKSMAVTPFGPRRSTLMLPLSANSFSPCAFAIMSSTV